MTGLVIVSSMADQGQVTDYVAELQVGTRHLELESLTALNKSATNYYLQLFNLPFSAYSARSATSDNNSSTNGVIGMAAHGFQDGDYITFGGSLTGAFAATAYVRRNSAGTFTVFDTLAHALDRTSLAGQYVTGIAGGNIIGTVKITDVADARVIPEEMPLLGTGSAPSNIISYLNGRFSRGLYVTAVTAINGSVQGGLDVKFTPRFRYAHGA